VAATIASDILDTVSAHRHVSWPTAVLAILCLVPVLVGVALVLGGEGGQPLGMALVGFFGAGVVVLGRKALAKE
jgi:hypothetical protein